VEFQDFYSISFYGSSFRQNKPELALEMVDIRFVLLDWGNTVMVEFPEYSGPMENWPRVEAVPGADTVLPELTPHFKLVLASSAEESDSENVRHALERAELGEYFQYIFTSRELGIGKTDPNFYLAIMKDLDISPEDAVMVGDSYPGDILSASRAGLRTIWINTTRAACPQIHPRHEAELMSIGELPLALEQMNLPTLQECIDYLRLEEAADNLVEHCLGVGACAYWTAVWMKDAGIIIDSLLTHRGGVLHDLDKITGQNTDLNHGEWSGHLLRDKGYPNLAKIAERHVTTRILDKETAPDTWEEKLVFYADKLIEGNVFVGLETRMQALKNRYPQFASKMDTSMPYIRDIERAILEVLELSRNSYYSKLAKLDFSL
jgi:FMN phosphatase YigB (HAD superfamily)